MQLEDGQTSDTGPVLAFVLMLRPFFPELVKSTKKWDGQVGNGHFPNVSQSFAVSYQFFS